MTTTSIDVERAPGSREAWLASNRQGLMEALDRVRRQIERAIDARHPADTTGTSGDDSREPEPTRTAAALVHLCTAFALSNFERDVLLMCAGAELDPKLSALYGRAHDDPRRAWPTFGLALAMLPDPHWSALTPAAPLRLWRLLDVVDPAPLVDSRLRLDERILHFLLGIQHIDVRLAGALTPLTASTLANEAPSPAAIHLSTVLTSDDERESVIAVSGPSVIERRAVVAAACAALDRRMLMLNAADVPQAPAERDSFVRLIERELVLTRGVLVLEIEESGSGADHAARRIAERFRGTLIVSSAMRPRELPRTVTAVDLRRPHALPERLVWPRAGLDEVAERIEPVASWADLVLPEGQIRTLGEIAAHVRQRKTVHERWGFAAKSRRGLGITALLAGPSGTGKTMAAEVMANELALDLYRVDLSQVVSKYIGETEKNLRRVFDAAEDGGAILLFDEADALFGKRSEVRDSHDRYANVEISYLLQRMEAYRGLAILTTNMRSALDPAFMRRLRFVVTFPFPDASQRAEIWRRIFPRETPTVGLQPDKLARLSVSGGHIRNIAMHAAFLAADAGDPVSMTHLAQAARSEYAKLERPLSDAEIAGWTE